MKIEHAPWLPTNERGVQGQKIAIVGYSHYVDGADSESVTNDVVQSVVDGDRKFRFFEAIQGYFGFEDSSDFWNRVIFFNFLPNSVGSGSEKYAVGTTEQLAHGRDRFIKIINDQKPDKVFVFTSKGWREFPETTLEELTGSQCKPLIQGQADPNWGTYEVGDHRVLVCGFRHPQCAPGEDMKKQVTAFLELQP